MSNLLHHGYTADYQKFGQRWVTKSIRPNDSRFDLLAETLPTATEEEGENILVHRIQTRIDQDIAERKEASKPK